MPPAFTTSGWKLSPSKEIARRTISVICLRGNAGHLAKCPQSTERVALSNANDLTVQAAFRRHRRWPAKARMEI
jgi:hypothetical protein